MKRGAAKRAKTSRSKAPKPAVARAQPAKTKPAARGARSTGVTYDQLRLIARELVGIEESTSYGTPALKISGQLLVRLKEDGETIVLKTTFVDRDLLMQADPNTYFITDHYRNYPYVLVRLSRINTKEMRGRLEEAWLRLR